MGDFSGIHQGLFENLIEGVCLTDRKGVITYWNKSAEKITGFKVDKVGGIFCKKDFVVPVNKKGVDLCTAKLCPQREVITKGCSCEGEIYFRHKDGHRIPVLIRIMPLRDSNEKIIGAAHIFNDISGRIEAQGKIKELQKLAYIDPLTKLANRRYTTINLSIKYEEMQRYKWKFGVVLIDIDHFKKVNDTFGHYVGDRVLKMVSKTLLANSRPFDTVGRWGGEEFVIIVANVNKKQLHLVANRLRMLVEKSSFFFNSKPIRVTISAGATLVRPKDTKMSLLQRIDKLMYSSKTAGRNRVTIK